MSAHCKLGAPCARHHREAVLAADAAEREYRRSAVEFGVPARDAARMAQGVRAHAYQSALERPLTPCTDGRHCEVGWPPREE